MKRLPIASALRKETTKFIDYVIPYVKGLSSVLDMEAIARAKIKIGVDPLGGSGVAFWTPIAEMYGLNLEILNRYVDPTFSFITLDWDGKIRMDCSSSYAMAGLLVKNRHGKIIDKGTSSAKKRRLFGFCTALHARSLYTEFSLVELFAA